MERSLSVLLPVHNHQSLLAATVQRMLEVLPELTRHFELLIIDDGSTDATIEVADELASQYPQIRVIRHSTPLGRLESLNAGLQRTSGDVILLYDENGGLSMKEIQRRWRAIGEPAAAPMRTPMRGTATKSASLWSESPPECGYQLIDRQAMQTILAQAGASAAQPGSSRPKRPNYMTRLRGATIGE